MKPTIVKTANAFQEVIKWKMGNMVAASKVPIGVLFIFLLIFSTLPAHISLITSDQYLSCLRSCFTILRKKQLRWRLNVNQIEESEKIVVRFIGASGGRDIITKVLPGDNLLAVGDNVGVKLPRACRTGLCGSCTALVKVIIRKILIQHLFL